jgi:uncharacterized membrane protein
MADDHLDETLDELVSDELASPTWASEAKKDKEALRCFATRFSANFSYILPSPEVLRGYEQIHPGITKTLLEMAQSEAQTRQYCAKRSMDAVARGQFIGGGIAIIGFGSAVFFAVKGLGGASVTSVIAGVAAIVASIVSSRISKDEDKEE